MTTAVLIAKSMQEEGVLPTKKVIYHCGKKLQYFLKTVPTVVSTQR